jgi:acetolactate synthase I/II/III large subunit
MLRVADYIAETVAQEGIRDVFMVTGGGAMHLNDAIGRCAELRYICCHHEQACAMAAEAYARLSGRPALVNVTTGPGGINAINGVFGAWTDSIPMLVVSGQVRRDTALYYHGLIGRLRQLGDQEADVLSMVRGITKYSVTIDDPQSIRYHLERAMHLAVAGRPGPCWIDVPVDVQGAMVDPDALEGYDPAEDRATENNDLLARQCREIIARLKQAKRPVIMPGSGVRLAGAVREFQDVIGKLGIPVTVAWTAVDLLPNDNPLYAGRPGTIGDRGGNFAAQNADFILIIGSKLNIRQVSYNWLSFARHAFKVQVDIDQAELEKPTVKPDMAVQADAKAFLKELSRAADAADYDPQQHAEWVAWCRGRVSQYPIVLARHRAVNGTINPYYFVDQLHRLLKEDDVVVCANGTASVVCCQVAEIKQGQRVLYNSGCASMGYDLPAAIGAAVANGGKRVICLAGDGSLQMNVQELQTLAHHRWPIKIFVLNNGGYASIRQTQKSFFGRLVGEGAQSGVSFPDFAKVAQAYGIPGERVEPGRFLDQAAKAIDSPGPALLDVVLDPEQVFEPKTSSKRLPDGRIVSAPLEDMWPFLEHSELLNNLFVPAMNY